jgi:hypothetical protein
MLNFLDELHEPLHDAHVYIWLGADLLIGQKTCPMPAPCPFHEHESFVMVLHHEKDVLKGAKRPRLWFVSCSCGANGPFGWSQSEALERWAISSRNAEGK